MPDGASVTVVGVADDRFEVLAPEARQALVRAGAVAGSRHHLSLWRSWPATAGSMAEILEIGDDLRDDMRDDMRDHVGEVRGNVGAVAAAVRRWLDHGRPVCVLASGDPGFFGVVRLLLGAVDRHELVVLPAPSAVSMAFARLALPWDDAVVVPVHGRPLADAVTAVRTARTAAVLTSLDAPPEALGAALVEAGASMDLVAVCERLGSGDESVRELTLAQLAGGHFDPRSVVVLVGPGGLPLVGWAPGAGTVLAWGAHEAEAGDPAAVVATPEARAVVLAKLALPASGVLWDVEAGSGSIAVESAMLRPGLTVLAVAARSGTAVRISATALARGAGVHVVPGRAPEALASLPAPDRAFVGGGDLAVLDAVLARLRPGGRVVAAWAALDRAAGAAERLGNMVELSVGRGEHAAGGGWCLAAHDPVFVTWGPG